MAREGEEDLVEHCGGLARPRFGVRGAWLCAVVCVGSGGHGGPGEVLLLRSFSSKVRADVSCQKNEGAEELESAHERSGFTRRRRRRVGRAWPSGSQPAEKSSLGSIGPPHRQDPDSSSLLRDYGVLGC